MGKWSRACIAILCFSFLTCESEALNAHKLITQYMRNAWGEKEGLPQNTVHTILQTRDGYLWIGTEDGLGRFDGVRFTVFDKSNTPELKSNTIWKLIEDREGGLWIATEGGGITRMIHGTFTTWTTREGLADNFVITLLEDADGSVWIGTARGLNRYRKGKLETFTKKDGLISDRVFAMLQDPKGTIWFGTPGGLIHFHDGKLETYTTKDGLVHDRIYALLLDHNQDLWIGTAAGLNRFREGKFETFTTKDGLTENIIFSLHEDSDHNLWIGSLGGGLNLYRNGQFTNLRAGSHLTSDYIFCLYEDHERNLWIGTGTGGVNRLRDGKFTFYTPAEGLSSEQIYAIFEDAAGNLWAGNQIALNRFYQGRFVDSAVNGARLACVAYGIIGDHQNNLWIACREGLKQFKKGIFADVSIPQLWPENNIPALLVDRTGALWIGTFHGIQKLENGKWTSLTNEQGLSSNRINQLLEDQQGKIWIGTSTAIDQFQNGTIKEIADLENDTESFWEDREGNVWIGTDGSGLYRYRNGKVVNISTRDGLFNDRIWSILEDDAQRLWMSCSKGIFRVNKKDLNDFADGKISRFTSVSYGTEDGLITKDFNTSGCKTRDGKLWFGSSKGIAMIDPHNIYENKVSISAIIEEVYVNEQKIPQPDFLRELSLNPESNRLEFRYTAPSFRAADRVRFRIKLEGADKNWIDRDTRRTAYYGKLPPGHYRFRVMAANDDGIWSKQTASVSFYLRPRFYQTGWFLGMSIFAAIAFAFSAYRIRMWNLQKREAELIRIVKEKTQELLQTNEKLREAQDRIAWLVESGPQALENVSAWSKLVAADLANILGARELSVWTVERDRLVSLVPGSSAPLTLQEVRALPSNIVAKGKDLLFPVKGMTGENYGVLIVSGSRKAWDETQMRLVAGFAHQLGGTLEMLQMRDKLARAQDKSSIVRRNMKEQGIVSVALCPTCGDCYEDSVENCRKDGTALDSPYLLPFRIGERYRLVRFLGKGGMGLVFQIDDEALKRTACMKIIPAEILSDPLVKRRLAREAQVIARIQHSNVVSIYDYGELPDGSAFLVMELLVGLDLQQLLKQQGAGTPAQVSSALRQAGEALHVAHSIGIVHRDLKPANMFLLPGNPQFQLKVLDFGLAKSVQEKTSLTLSGMIMGTPAYMSPEQIRGESLTVQSDLFSLAVTCYELLTARKPFDAESVPELFMKVLLESAPPLPEHFAGANNELNRLFFQAMEKNPAKRPAGIREWSSQIADLLLNISAIVPGWKLL